MYTDYSRVKTAVSIILMLGGSYATTTTYAPEVVRIRTKPNHLAKAKTTLSPTVVYRIAPEVIRIGAADEPKTSLEPKTALGRKLLALREKALSHGMSLLTAEEINVRVKDARGEEV